MNDTNEFDSGEFDSELLLAAEDYGFWPGVFEPFELNTLGHLTAKQRKEVSAKKAKAQAFFLRIMAERNHCGSVVMGFGSQACAKIFFESPWRRRFKRCSDYVETAKRVWVMHASSWCYRRKWLNFFRHYGDAVRKSWMDEKELRRLHRLPKRFLTGSAPRVLGRSPRRFCLPCLMVASS